MSDGEPLHTRRRLLAKVAAASQSTTSALARVLATLKEEGLLDAEAASRRDISDAIYIHARTETPYGGSSRLSQSRQSGPSPL